MELSQAQLSRAVWAANQSVQAGRAEDEYPAGLCIVCIGGAMRSDAQLMHGDALVHAILKYTSG